MECDKIIATAKKTFFEALRDTQVPSENLTKMLSEMQQCDPQLFTQYAIDAVCEPIDTDSLNWNERYFSGQCKLAEFNFSKERLAHLITVRDYFRQHRHKGFSPKAFVVTAEKAPRDAMQFQPSTNLLQSVDEGDLLLIRIALLMDLNDNKLKKEYLLAALRWAQAKVPELCEPYTENPFCRGMDQNRENWDKDYYFLQASYLNKIFSEERFLHMVDVREYLRQQNVPGFEPAVPSRAHQQPKSTPLSSLPSVSPNSQKSVPSHPQQNETNPLLKAAYAIGGALAALVVLIIALGRKS